MTLVDESDVAIGDGTASNLLTFCSNFTKFFSVFLNKSKQKEENKAEHTQIHKNKSKLTMLSKNYIFLIRGLLRYALCFHGKISKK
jgi:hypothetical protein